MNSGVIASRYAKALLSLSLEDGSAEQVFSQALLLLQNPRETPSPPAKNIERLALLLRKNGRGEYLRLILNDYTRLYCSATGAKMARLTMAEPSEELPRKISALIGGKVYMQTEVDSSIQGGFLLTVGDKLLDASVKGQLERIRRQFLALNKRIV